MAVAYVNFFKESSNSHTYCLSPKSRDCRLDLLTHSVSNYCRLKAEQLTFSDDRFWFLSGSQSKKFLRWSRQWFWQQDLHSTQHPTIKVQNHPDVACGVYLCYEYSVIRYTYLFPPRTLPVSLEKHQLCEESSTGRDLPELQIITLQPR